MGSPTPCLRGLLPVLPLIKLRAPKRIHNVNGRLREYAQMRIAPVRNLLPPKGWGCASGLEARDVLVAEAARGGAILNADAGEDLFHVLGDGPRLRPEDEPDLLVRFPLRNPI